MISRQTNLNNELIERKTLKTNFEKKTIEIFKRNNQFDSTAIITDKTKRLELKVFIKVIIFCCWLFLNILFQKSSESNLVMVETTKNNLTRLEMSVQSDYCIIVNGALSSGKTSLIQYLADKNNRKLIKYQMDDFMDSKVSFLF